MRVPDDVFSRMCADMVQAEQSGELDEMFLGECQPSEQSGETGREPFLAALSPGMRLFKSTFKKILGYEMTWPGFAEEALSRLEEMGCTRAREYYETVRSECQQEHDRMKKSVAEWYSGETERKVVRESRTEKEAEQLKEQLRAGLQQKSDRELLTLLQRLRQNGA